MGLLHLLPSGKRKLVLGEKTLSEKYLTFYLKESDIFIL
jgi:hypothetical protein